MQGPPKILLAGLAALAMTIAPILSLDGATCGGFIYTIDKTLTTTPNACTALIENLRVDRSLLMSEGVANLIETSTTAVVENAMVTPNASKLWPRRPRRPNV